MHWTQYYNFPQWEAEDITTWKGQLNDAFEHLDNILYILGHKTYATVADYEEMQRQIEAVTAGNVELKGELDGLTALVGELHDDIHKIQEDVNAKLEKTCEALNLYALELHSAKADIELLKQEVAEIGNKLVAWYFPCMHGTTLPGTDEVPNGKGGD